MGYMIPCRLCQGIGRERTVPVDTPYKVLGQWRPKVYETKAMQVEFGEWLKERGITHDKTQYVPDLGWAPNRGIRVVEPHDEPFHYDEQWHQDGQRILPMAESLIIWCNHTPTEIIDTVALKRIIFQPFDVLYFDNQRCIHRTAPVVDKSPRWFLRVWNPILP